MHAHHRLECGGQRVQVALLAGVVTGPGVQDVPTVEDQDEHVDLGGLQALLRGSILRERQRERWKEKEKKGRERERFHWRAGGAG